MFIPSKVSVIIPCYNAEAYLSQAIESVLAQTYSNVEIIVVDDGSTDASCTVAERYGIRITFIRQKNSGVSAARNAAIAASTGEYLAFLDADDYWLPNKLERQIPAFTNPKVGLVHSYHVWVDSDGNLQEKRFHTEGYVFHSLLEHCTVGTLTAVVRRNALPKVSPFDTQLRTGEDWDLWLRISLHNEVAVIPEVLSCYRVHDSSLTSRNHLRIARELFQVLQKHSHSHKDCLQCRISIAKSKQHIRQVYSSRIVYERLNQARRGLQGNGKFLDAIRLNPRLILNINFYKILSKIGLYNALPSTRNFLI